MKKRAIGGFETNLSLGIRKKDRNIILNLATGISAILLLLLPARVNAFTFAEVNIVNLASNMIIDGKITFDRNYFNIVTGIDSLQVDHEIDGVTVTVFYDVDFRYTIYEYGYSTNNPFPEEMFFLGEPEMAMEAGQAIIDALGSTESILFAGYDTFDIPFFTVYDGNVTRDPLDPIGCFVFRDIHTEPTEDLLSTVVYNDDIDTPAIYTFFTPLTVDILETRGVIESIETQNTGGDPVPEPSSLLLLGAGLLGIAGVYRTRGKK